jgi:hypothetical protein
MEAISTYNGDTTDKYNWSQGLTELTVQLKIPEGTTPKMLDVVMKPRHISIKIKGGETLLEGDLFEKIKVEDSFWSVEERKFLVLNLEKQGEVIWKTIITGD